MRRALAGAAGLVAVVAVAGVLALALAGDDDDPRASAEARSGGGSHGDPAALAGATPWRTLVVLPDIGRLSWRCDDESRFATRFELSRRGATVFATAESDDRSVFHRRAVHPDPPGPAAATTPFAEARRQKWRLVFHHPVPGPMTATVEIWFDHGKRGGCYVPHWTSDVASADTG